MAHLKNAVFSFNGGLYFHLYKNSTAGILTSLSNLVSSSQINITTPTFNLTENLAEATSTPFPTLVFNGTTYPMTSITLTSSNITGIDLTVFSPLHTFV